MVIINVDSKKTSTSGYQESSVALWRDTNNLMFAHDRYGVFGSSYGFSGTPNIPTNNDKTSKYSVCVAFALSNSTTFLNNYVKLYRNGTLLSFYNASSLPMYALTDTSCKFSIGCDLFDGIYQFPYGGLIDEFFIFNRELTATEIAVYGSSPGDYACCGISKSSSNVCSGYVKH